MRREYTAHQLDTADETPGGPCAGGGFGLGPEDENEKKPKPGKRPKKPKKPKAAARKPAKKPKASARKPTRKKRSRS